jgi:ParB family chromosome partitioning protein
VETDRKEIAMDKRPALGRGLSALIPDEPAPRTTPADVDIDRLSPNQYQPRLRVDDAKLEELAQSVAAHGVIQPIVVRKVDGDRFEIIAGERRWRAARRAGLMRVPIVVKDVAPDRERSLLEMALIENIQRENLNPIDEAQAYRRLADEFQLTQEDVAAAVGKDRATVANHLRLLRLPDDVRNDVASGRLSMGHARALLSLGEADVARVAREVIARGLSVRETEALVKKIADGSRPKAPAKAAPTDVHTRAAEDRLRLLFGTQARIVRRGGHGRIEIDFGSEDELIRIFELLTERG